MPRKAKPEKPAPYQINQFLAIQSLRIIGEGVAAGIYNDEAVRDMAASMDLNPAQLRKLINMCNQEWESLSDSIASQLDALKA